MQKVRSASCRGVRRIMRLLEPSDRN
jgi:hypothetical protein